MNIRPRSFSVLYGVQRRFLNVFYLISIIAVFWLIFYLLNDIFQTGGALIILVSIAYLVLGIVGYSLIQVISYIPANLAGAFDPIKNGIADRSINSGEVLAERIAAFFCTFFNFAFFDVESSMVLLEGHEVRYSGDGNLRDLEPGEITEFIAREEETRLFSKPGIKGGSGYIYVIPLIFGKTRLGYVVISTRQKLRKMFIELLNEFENDFLDDQVLHVLAREKGALS